MVPNVGPTLVLFIEIYQVKDVWGLYQTKGLFGSEGIRRCALYYILSLSCLILAIIWYGGRLLAFSAEVIFFFVWMVFEVYTLKIEPFQTFRTFYPI